MFCVNGDSEWRGLGVIESSGVHLTPDYQRFDAEAHFRPAPQQVCDDPRARCGEVLTGKCKPHQCPLFGNTCNPQTAFGGTTGLLRRSVRRVVSVSSAGE